MPFMFLSAFSDEDTVAQVKALGAVAYLVKPLDIGQIVPAVDAAFAHIRAAARAAPAASAPARRRRRAPASATRRRAAMAVGVLMHRYLARARRGAGAAAAMAAAEAGSRCRDQAERLLAAVEELGCREGPGGRG